eukprot:snap_masked-scaffold304_size215464-processed-gene-1.7 protein:Tk10788 transcript:snap_masked-scaffold304_size215464-processed-gene-1.7-mRNA-1 annotation:"hypothetical protein DAPPUDRAFT_301580"
MSDKNAVGRGTGGEHAGPLGPDTGWSVHMARKKEVHGHLFIPVSHAAAKWNTRVHLGKTRDASRCQGRKEIHEGVVLGDGPQIFIALALVAAASAAPRADKPAPAPYQPEPRYAPAPYQPAYKPVEPPKYEYAYAVADHETYTNFEQNEARDGYATNGEYRVNLPDGRTQIVTYSVQDGDSGYVADVRYEGEAQYPEEKPKTAYQPAPKYAPAPKCLGQVASASNASASNASASNASASNASASNASASNASASNASASNASASNASASNASASNASASNASATIALGISARCEGLSHNPTVLQPFTLQRFILHRSALVRRSHCTQNLVVYPTTGKILVLGPVHMSLDLDLDTFTWGDSLSSMLNGQQCDPRRILVPPLVHHCRSQSFRLAPGGFGGGGIAVPGS